MIRYAITENTFRPGLAARWAAEGVDVIQLRDKHLTPRARACLAKQILAELRNTPTRLLINHRADIALATGAHGVHLTAHPAELTPQHIRNLYRIASVPTPIISISCHTLEDVTRAHAAQPDYILFGPIFEKRLTPTSTLPGIGLAQLSAACRLAPQTPILALGGITTENTQSCLNAGAAGIAAIRLFA